VLKAVLWVALGLVLACVLFIGGYVTGAGLERTKYNSELARITADGERDRAELERRLGEAKTRIDSIGNGLAEAVGLASQATDRNKRIAILVGAIDAAIKGTSGSSGSPEKASP
jgi:hypothetical protein